MKFWNLFLSFIFFLLPCQKILATHNRAGEITFRQIGNLSIEVTVTTYTKASSVAADRDSLEFFWGDNTCDFIKRNNNLTKFAANDVKINYYVATHTYPGSAMYTMYFVDPNRVSTILNINYPNSVDIPFFLSTTFTLLNQQFQGPNNSVILLQPPLDIACAGKKFTHNPNGFDLDKDSLVYELAVPLQAVNLPVPGYKYPDEISPGPNNKMSINPVTGEFTWDAPVLQGEYNIAIRILEYRKGKLINIVLRDMQILVRSCLNDPPTISVIPELCVIAGEKIELDILVNDINNGQKVRLYSTGGPFEVDSPGELITPVFFSAPPLSAKFTWQTNCSHISKDYYQVVLRAVDNYFGDSSGLATLKTLRIKVVGPPPENLESKAQQGNIQLSWNGDYSCQENDTKAFTGFAVYRSVNSIPFVLDTCYPGLTNKGYTKIAVGVKNKINNEFIYLDQNVEKGRSYCYRVVAEFSQFTANNLPFDKIEGLASEESCIRLSREIPLLTKVSVESTDPVSGEIQVSWTKPSQEALDSLGYSGPYTFEFYRSTNKLVYDLLPLQSVTVDKIVQIMDTAFIDTGLNTRDISYFYKIRVLNKNVEIGYSEEASSIFLEIIPSDKSLLLTWKSSVPWSNFNYLISKDSAGILTLVGSTADTFFYIKDLSNQKDYCYKIQSFGSYNFPDYRDTLLNLSQKNCARPLDNIAPCPTVLTVKNPCDLIQSGVSFQDLFNLLEWKDISNLCPSLSRDAVKYNIYTSSSTLEPFKLLMSIEDIQVTTYTHYTPGGLSGCYYVTTIDSLGNESIPSNVVCIENCPLYVLPNTFTPNQDNHNDLFIPMTNYFIETVDFKVYNQWGNQVFYTTDPNISWDGKTKQGKDLADGVYHYTCKIFSKQVDGKIKEEPSLHGFIQIIR